MESTGSGLNRKDESSGKEAGGDGLLYESFYQVDGSRTNAGEGSGIGLAVVKEIVEGHGGHIHAENRNGLTMVIILVSAWEK